MTTKKNQPPKPTLTPVREVIPDQDASATVSALWPQLAASRSAIHDDQAHAESHGRSWTYGAPAAPVDESKVYRVGVQVHGPWWKPGDGIGIATRRTMQAFLDAGVPVRAQACPTWEEQMDPGVSEQVGHLRQNHLKCTAAYVHHMTLTASPLRYALYPGGSGPLDHLLAKVHPYKVAWLWFERDKIARDEVELLRKFGALWTSNRWAAKVLENHGLQAEVMPVPYDFSDPLAQTRKVSPPPGAMYGFYHVGKWEPRKNHYGMMRLFLSTFRPGEPVGFFLKTSPFWHGSNQYPASAEDALRWLVMDDQEVKARGWDGENVVNHIRIQDGTVPFSKIQEYHRSSHCYLSLAHAEGWDLPCFDAVVAGSHVIATASGGPEEFVQESSIISQSDWSECSREYQWPAGSRWPSMTADEEERVKRAMREAFDNRWVGLPARLTDGSLRPELTRFSLHRVGERMRESIASMLRRIGDEKTALLLEEEAG